MDINKVIIIVLLLVAVVGYIRLYRHYRRNIKKVTFLFDAIDNGDFSFNFPTEKRFKEDKILHQSLNRIKLFLQHTREEQMEREKYYEQILNAVDTGILVVDSHDNILQHNQAALQLLDTDVLTHMNQVKGKLKDEHLAKHETQAMLKDKHVRIIALSDVSHELSNQEVDSWIKLIRVLTHEIMNTITPVTSLSETLLTRVTEDKYLKQGLETIHKTGTELLAFVNNYRRNIKKVTFLFDAIDNGDFSFNFPTEKRFKEDNILHQSLNRIKLFLQHTREEQMDREKYYEQILNAVDTGILVVDSHDNILQHNQAALRLLDTDVLTHMNQVKGKLKDEHLAKHETQAMLKDKHVRIIALSDVSHELSNQEVDSWIKLIRVLTHEIMNTITPVTSLSETLLKELGSKELLIADNESDDLHSPGKLIKVSENPQSAEQAKLKQGLKTIHKTGTELLAFVNNYRRFTHVPQPKPALFYVEPFLERMALLCNHEVEIEVSPKDLLVYADESLLSHVVTNLLKNAVEAFREKGKLSAERNKQDGNEQGRNKQECRSADLQSAASKKAFIRLHAYANAQESIIIDVSNNAGLIPEDVASHIFIPFFTTKPEGSGIGLSLSRQIMRVSGGNLSLHQDKAQGITTFRIIIP